MATNYETGHAKNVANFQALISIVKGYDNLYNPSRSSIQLNSLNLKVAEAQTAMDTLNAKLAAYGNATASRETAFEPLQKLSTKLLSALKATEVSEAVIDNFASLNRKQQGKRASKKISTAVPASLTEPAQPSPNQISASQQSFDNQLDTFDKQVQLLASIPQYTPNETELTIASLQAHYAALKNENAGALDQGTALTNARLKRNEVMYHPETGMLATAVDVKNYVKSLFGASSANYKQIYALAFRTLK